MIHLLFSRRRFFFALALLLFLFSCGHAPVHLLTTPPVSPYRTLGMVSGHGENESSATAMLLDQASRIEADAVIVQEQRTLGRQILVTGRAIKYLAPPPQ
jgi:hypothetical protein